jgi:hypothetical protein
VSQRKSNLPAKVLAGWRADAAKRRGKRRRTTKRQTVHLFATYCREVISCQPSAAAKRAEAAKQKKERRRIAIAARRRKSVIAKLYDAVQGS